MHTGAYLSGQVVLHLSVAFVRACLCPLELIDLASIRQLIFIEHKLSVNGLRVKQVFAASEFVECDRVCVLV